MVTTRPPKTIVKPTALSPVANTDTKLLIYGLFQKGRVLAQDGLVEQRKHHDIENADCDHRSGFVVQFEPSQRTSCPTRRNSSTFADGQRFF